MSDLMKDAKRLREERFRTARQAQELVAVAQKEERSLNSDERLKFDQMMTACSELEVRFGDIEKSVSLCGTDPAAEAADLRQQVNRQADRTGAPTVEMQERAFQAWSLAGTSHLTPQHEEAAKACNVDLRANTWTFHLPSYRGSAPRSVAEFRSMKRDNLIRFAGSEVFQRATTAQTTTTVAGGHTIQNETMQALEEALLSMGTMRTVGRVIRTATGANLPIPTANQNDSGSMVAINTQVIAQSLTFGQQTLGAKKFSSNLVYVPIELLQDTTLNLPAYIGDVFGRRIARVTEQQFATGASTLSEMEGLITAGSTGGASAGATQSSETNIQYADLVNVIHYVDSNLRPGSRFMFHDSVLKNLRGQLDSDGRPLWVPSVAADVPDLICGFPYTVNAAYTTYTGSTTGQGVTAKLATFGRHDHYVIRDVMDISVMRLNERYMDLGQVGFIAFSRHDAQLVSGVAGTTDSDVRLITAAAS